jgi:hypothetical protein
MRRLFILAPLLVSSCSAADFSASDRLVSECFAMSIVYKNMAKFTDAPSDQQRTMETLNRHYTNVFQNTVARISEGDGDVNGYSAMTKKTMRQVADAPLEWKDRFMRCTPERT